MKPETQYIRPQGFDSARFGFTDKMSTQVEQWLSDCTRADLRSAVETVFHATDSADRASAAQTALGMGADLPSFLRDAIDLATANGRAGVGQLAQLIG